MELDPNSTRFFVDVALDGQNFAGCQLSLVYYEQDSEEANAESPGEETENDRGDAQEG